MKTSTRRQYLVEDLLYLMARLRNPDDGCPWDIKQDYLSITPSTIEEAYEVVDAIEQKDYDHLKEELGDLLFQVVFYGQLAKEENRWQFSDVVHELTAKLIRRHPHVFPDGTLQSRREAGQLLTEGDIKASWENIKQQERGEKGKERLLDDVPRALPALKRAEKLQKRAAKVGFDWAASIEVVSKLEEEIAELKSVLNAREVQANEAAEELGDVLFSCVNLARHLKVDSEQVLRGANLKFEQRFNYIETELVARGQTLENATLADMDALWGQAKNNSQPVR
ncbi:nucleoside triphosphate pyrophosphohydrolase [Teredinibacter franksiae]|uniref:nucleoside triphosphate pyrophosphohydrolase n=1 Tax=Teredinibacter franksiae TaxID=2761453 RepID=UPI0028AB94E9|nr:nucleoside triphosphate pyrophosphohydrolase [Teredinibacter franksiae]